MNKNLIIIRANLVLIKFLYNFRFNKIIYLDEGFLNFCILRSFYAAIFIKRHQDSLVAFSSNSAKD